MADNPKKRGKGDRARVSKVAHEVDYLKAKYGVSGQQAAGAIRAVGGKSRPKVEAYLRQKASQRYAGLRCLAGVRPRAYR